MRFILSLPLTLIPLIIYNVVALGGGETASTAFQAQMFAFQMVSGAQFQLLLGDMLLTFALLLLFAEMLKATRTGSSALLDHILSMLVFVAYLVEFLIAAPAATSIFFILMVIALIDVIAGFSITISGARRDVAFGHDDR